MKHSRTSAVLAFAFLLVTQGCTPVDQSLLSQLAIPEDELRDGYTAMNVPADFVPGKTIRNPGVISDLEVIQALCKDDYGGILDISAVEAMFFSVYRVPKETSETGVFAWQMASPDSAKAFHTGLSTKYKDEPERWRFWLHGRTVIMLWRDPGTPDDFFKQFQKYVEQVVAKNEGKRQKGTQQPPQGEK